MTLEPDEDNDVMVVHRFSKLHLETWTIWIGGEKQAERTSLEAATEIARDIALMRSRPAWLLDETGYPLNRIECSRGG